MVSGKDHLNVQRYRLRCQALCTPDPQPLRDFFDGKIPVQEHPFQPFIGQWIPSSSLAPKIKYPPFARCKDPDLISVKSVVNAPNRDSFSIRPRRFVTVGLSSEMTGAPFKSLLSIAMLISYLLGRRSDESLAGTGPAP